ncbi:hypothetical protein BD324DRAFT_649662 [Kockovaella imperatae]|uniref:HMG box domain-containing protein n=1 Tax=Kockovaella imperatae TaxID=4999 RepID=A0A1Y1UMC6_9TREE|nr:hypothetical protein BD324DRAFT_649662 [Kockovaella imperatae]ORX38285.1 hypothetical protein BD324DRAFT_649662 [Kockovaella imperatae]
MSTMWHTAQHLVDSPAPLEEHQVSNFFQVVPPTPRHAQHQQAVMNNMRHASSPLSNGTHGVVSSSPPTAVSTENLLLQPSDSYGLRSHRSSFSVGSIDSHISNVSGFSGQWSTISSSESVADSDDVSTRHSFSRQRHGRQVSLSIDPKLFQPKDKGSQAGSETDVLDRAVDIPDESNVPTAVPASKKVKTKPAPKKKSASSMTAEERKKVSHARKQQPDHIPRPRNAFILFRKHVVDSKLIPASVEMRHQNVSIITAKMWSEAPPAQKSHFNELAKKEKEDHMRKYPGYRYQPVYRRTNVIRRRVRKDEAEEEKCRSVAELLLKGKSGEALEQEIKEKIQRGEHIPTPKKIKAPAIKADSASELSKGALRALRAQARHDSVGSGDWSDLASRANSLDPDGEGLTRAITREPGADVDGFQDYDFARAAGHFGLAQDPVYGYSDGMGYVHPALGGEGWNFGQPERSQMEAFGDWSTEYPDQIPGYAYPQPQTQTDYQAFDATMPFSNFAQDNTHSGSSVSSTSQHLAGQLLPDINSSQGMINNKVSTDVFMPQAFPSPTSVLYPGIGTMPNNANGPTGRLSARWDNTHFTLPPSHDISFGSIGMTMDSIDMSFPMHMGMGLPIGVVDGSAGNDQDAMLNNFGAALAQADEMAEGEWEP